MSPSAKRGCASARARSRRCAWPANDRCLAGPPRDRPVSMTASEFSLEAPNQSPPFVDRNFFDDDLALQEAAARAGLDAEAEDLPALGKIYGSAELIEAGRLANEFPPELRLVDARGNRLDTVEFHPA